MEAEAALMGCAAQREERSPSAGSTRYGCPMTDWLTDDELDELERLSAANDPPPWKAWFEGRDHTSGDSFIQVGEGAERADDLYVSRENGPPRPVDLDLIAAARNALPRLLDEIRRRRDGSA